MPVATSRSMCDQFSRGGSTQLNNASPTTAAAYTTKSAQYAILVCSSAKMTPLCVFFRVISGARSRLPTGRLPSAVFGVHIRDGYLPGAPVPKNILGEPDVGRRL